MPSWIRRVIPTQSFITHCSRSLWIHIQLLIKAVLMSIRNLFRLPLISLIVPRLWNYIGTCGRFTEHDLEKSGFVKNENFPSVMHDFLATPVKHGLETPSKDTYETLFKKYDPRNDGRLTVDEWISLAKEEVYKKFL